MRRKLLNFKRSSTTDNPPTEYGAPIDVTDDGSFAPAPLAADLAEQVVTTGSVFDSVLSQELLAPSVGPASPPPGPAPASVASDVASFPPPTASDPTTEQSPTESPSVDSDPSLDREPPSADPGEQAVGQPFDAKDSSGPIDLDAPLPALSPLATATPTLTSISTPAFPELSFWDRYDEASASAELFAVPPAAITAVVGALHVAIPVAERCRASHWVTECDVYVLTSRPELVEDPSWKLLKRPSDVVALLDDGLSDFPLLVVDIPRELPTWIRPLTSRLRAGGVGLVRYVLDDDPSDEDLATWHGELGRPSVLDLVAAVPPARVLDLLDRGEPVASVGGMPITADLLMALRLSV